MARARSRRPAVPRMVGLIRVSKVGGRGDDLLSPDMQRTAISGYAEQRGYLVARWVEALDESGSVTRSLWWRRLDQAVEWVEDGEIDGILVWKFARAARHRRRWAVALDRVEVAGGILESATEQVDTSTSTGRLARGMLAEMAAWEAEVKGEQWKEVHANRLSRGLPATGRRRFGYRVSPGGTFVPDPVEGPIVRQMYERFVSGDVPSQIAQWLDGEGVKTTPGGYWNDTSVRRFLDSGFGAGVLIHNGAEHPGGHEPVVPPALWAAYLRKRETTRRMPPRLRRGVHPLSGLVKCGTCHGPGCLQRLTGGRAPRFRCCKQGNLGRAACAGPSISADIALDAVREWLEEVAEDLDVRAAAVAEQRAAAKRARVETGRWDKEVQRIDKALAALAVQAVQHLLPASAYELARQDLTRDRDAAEARLRAAEEDTAALAAPAPRLARSILTSWDELVEHDPSGLRDVLASLIARVEIQPGDEGAARGRRHRAVVVPRWLA